MYSINSNLIKLLPKDIIDYILNIAGYHKFRNGKFITQLDFNKNIFKLLIKMPLFKQCNVKLYVKTKFFSKTYCDKIITLYIFDYYNDNYDDYGDILMRTYDCSWYSYDECNARHKIETEENKFIFVD